MPGTVFISCGQRPPRENKIALKIKQLISEKFGLPCYVAFKIQSLKDIMRVIEQLQKADYFIFIDFVRKGENLTCSLFSHQELALAYHLKFDEIIAFQEEGAPLEGFLRYLQANPEIFRDENDLLNKIESSLSERNWSKNYSRNLVACEPHKTGPVRYRDKTGENTEYIYHLKITNNRHDIAAVNSVCILDYIAYPDGRNENSNDRNYIKWAGQSGYDRTILPNDYGILDLFSLHAEQPGVFLHSNSDFFPRSPIIVQDGQYMLWYKLFSYGFPLLTFGIKLDYNFTTPVENKWENNTNIELVT